MKISMGYKRHFLIHKKQIEPNHLEIKLTPLSPFLFIIKTIQTIQTIHYYPTHTESTVMSTSIGDCLFVVLPTQRPPQISRASQITTITVKNDASTQTIATIQQATIKEVMEIERAEGLSTDMELMFTHLVKLKMKDGELSCYTGTKVHKLRGRN